METCSELRPHTAPTELGAYRSGSKYGFVEKVIDGMTVSINSVYVRFNSPSFTTSFHVSILYIHHFFYRNTNVLRYILNGNF